MNLDQFRWINPPEIFTITADSLEMVTMPETDFWQRTYYGFQHDNAHAFLSPVTGTEFSFTVKAAWKPAKLFDQCGIVLYQDADNWFKASVEYEGEKISKLGSVVTNLGFSDWATTDIDSSHNEMTYRLSRRGPDFLIENSLDGKHFAQMRVLHMHQAIEAAVIGVYACSPLVSTMPVTFTGFNLGPCEWELYTNPDE
jgi:regulation of enolase protein 1 (concanavalin A-like superfamily)